VVEQNTCLKCKFIHYGSIINDVKGSFTTCYFTFNFSSFINTSLLTNLLIRLLTIKTFIILSGYIKYFLFLIHGINTYLILILHLGFQNKDNPIIKLIKLRFLLRNQYIGPFFTLAYFRNSKKNVPHLWVSIQFLKYPYYNLHHLHYDFCHIKCRMRSMLITFEKQKQEGFLIIIFNSSNNFVFLTNILKN
jgi:hypothetical protein